MTTMPESPSVFTLASLLSAVAGGIIAGGVIVGAFATFLRPHFDRSVLAALDRMRAAFKEWNDNLYKDELLRSRDADMRTLRTLDAVRALESDFTKHREAIEPAAHMVARMVDTLDRVDRTVNTLAGEQRVQSDRLTTISERQNAKAETFDRFTLALDTIDERQRASQEKIAALEAIQNTTRRQ